MDGNWSAPVPGASIKSLKTEGKKIRRVSKPAIKSSATSLPGETPLKREESKYNALVVDSGAIIKHAGYSALHNAASNYYTVPGVITEIRDEKARRHLESLPFQLKIREPSKDGMYHVIEFSKKTGDYPSLSAVDLQVLGLLYDLEKESCTDMSHIRNDPKRVLGVGRIEPLSTKDVCAKSEGNTPIITGESKSFFEIEDENQTTDSSDEEQQTKEINDCQDPLGEQGDLEIISKVQVKSSWATITSPQVSSYSSITDVTNEGEGSSMPDASPKSRFRTVSIGSYVEEEGNSGGQFSDAEQDEITEEHHISKVNDMNMLESENMNPLKIGDKDDLKLKEELCSDFPSLAASSTIPYNGDDDYEINAIEQHTMNKEDELAKAEQITLDFKAASLKPVSRSGKLYNSFGKYKNLISSSGVEIDLSMNDAMPRNDDTKTTEDDESKVVKTDISPKSNETKKGYSRIMGGAGTSGQCTEVEDNGEGWVSSANDIKAMKVVGSLDPGRSNNPGKLGDESSELMPLKSIRAACATTDFAMQNVILQMNLELIGVDGYKVRKLKSWVTRCGACYTVYSGESNDANRLFCGRCGSDALQRVAASVNGKTGRLRLHLSKKYKNNLRGTKFNLPKAGKGNRFQGELLLREDQLLYGAWGQKSKQSRGKKENQCLFGSDINAMVGCNTELTKRDDIRVGFGRRNPNASKFGRERRGKKKKGTDTKVCGLRRY